MIISRGDFAAMPRRTPTELAEEVYQARPRKTYPTITGPAGLPIPDPRQDYRPTMDPALATTIGRAAYGAYRAALLTPAREAATAAALATVLEAKYPASDMIVLRRYDLAQIYGRIRVDMGIMFRHRVLELPEPLLLPNGKDRFRTNPDAVGEDLPADQLAFFDDIAAAKLAERDFMAVQTWPSSFKAMEGRWPRWGEIEKGVPLVGAWMAAQREGA